MMLAWCWETLFKSIRSVQNSAPSPIPKSCELSQVCAADLRGFFPDVLFCQEHRGIPCGVLFLDSSVLTNASLT